MMCRLSRVSAMFASRACRSAIMIGTRGCDPLTISHRRGLRTHTGTVSLYRTGTALSKKEMKRVLHNLTLLDNPWSCPHGRPTMRHLFDLSTIASLSPSSSAAVTSVARWRIAWRGSPEWRACSGEPVTTQQ
jgi:DNA mismatch repair protein PMS2